MTRPLSITHIGETEDTDEPVIKAEFDDTGSHLTAILHDDLSVVRVWLVDSKRKGDMKLILDEVCRQLETRTVHFLQPELGVLDEVLDPDSYERVERDVTGPDGETVTSTFYDCTWAYDE